MLHGLWKLTWVELKIFLREPLGAIGTIVIPVVVFILVGRAIVPKDLSKFAPANLPPNSFIGVGLPVFVSVFISISAVLSLVTCATVSLTTFELLLETTILLTWVSPLRAAKAAEMSVAVSDTVTCAAVEPFA